MAPKPTETAAPAVRAPQQQRSRERVERILAVAKQLIAEQGSDAMKMGEVAERAEISIGSLYQYFPDKAAIVRTLAERYNEEGRICIRDGLAGVRTAADLRRAFGELIDIYYGIFLAEPVMRDIWSGTQADKTLQDIDLIDSRENGALLARALETVHPKTDRATLASKALLIMHLGTSTMRLALAVGRKEGDKLVAAYKELALRDMLAR